MNQRRSNLPVAAARPAAPAACPPAPAPAPRFLSAPPSFVPQFPQNRAPATIGAPHVGQPMRDPQFRQNFVSGGFSVEHVAQITVARLYPSRRARAG